MATLYITEFADMKQWPNSGRVLMGALPTIVAEQTVSIGSSTASSAGFNAATRFVRVHTDAICSIEYGSAPVATTANARLAAGSTEYFGVNPGDKIAVIVNT